MELKWFVIKNEGREGVPIGAVTLFTTGWGNGYAAVPPDHPWWGKGYNEIDHDQLSLQNEITFARTLEKVVDSNNTWSAETDNTIAELSKDGWWVFGFDTAHYGMTAHNWPKERVEKEAAQLAVDLWLLWVKEKREQNGIQTIS